MAGLSVEGFIMKSINIANEYSPEPAGRYYTDGTYSGERFRQEILIPEINNNDKLVINFCDLEGYGSSFIEEVFGGLVRYGFFDSEYLHDKLIFETDDPSLEEEIWSYIDDAGFGSEEYISTKTE